MMKLRTAVYAVVCAFVLVGNITVGVSPLGAGLVSAHAASSGLFRANCKFVYNLQADPIVSPGAVSEHMHSFFGNKSTNQDSTYASMVAALTSCKLAGDTAAYWIPTLYDSNGSPVPVNGLSDYYRDWPADTVDQTVTPFPPDFRVVSGYPDPSHNSTLGATRFPTASNWGFQCDNASALQASAAIDCSSNGKGVKFVINFPSCGMLDADGNVVADSIDHRSHVVFPSSTGCPPDHPVKLPFVYLKVTYGVQNCITSGCYLSSDITKGTPPGASGHADFWNTWQQPSLEALVETCLNLNTSCGNNAS